MEITDFEKIKRLTTHQRKFGETYLVKNVTSGELGVLKMLLKSEFEKSLSSQLKNESKFTFHHNGLPEIWCVFENDKYFSFVKKYQEGILWKDYLEKLSDKDFYLHLPLAISQILQLLHIVHQKGIIHGDIKPTNLLVHAHSPTNFQIEIIDFGMSFMPNQMDSSQKLPFSLGYSAPEIMLNRRDLANETSDFYSLGICILQLFTGKIPLFDPNPEFFMNFQLTLPFEKPDKIPKSLWNIVSQMLQKGIFNLPPNQLSNNEIEKIIKEGIKKRTKYDNLLDQFTELKIERKWFRYR